MNKANISILSYLIISKTKINNKKTKNMLPSIFLIAIFSPKKQSDKKNIPIKKPFEKLTLYIIFHFLSLIYKDIKE